MVQNAPEDFVRMSKVQRSRTTDLLRQDPEKPVDEPLIELQPVRNGAASQIYIHIKMC